MSILSKIGITKEAIARLLGIHRTVEVQDDSFKPKTKTVHRGRGRPKGQKIPQRIVDAVRKAHHTSTNQELADKYGVSNYWVWCIRHNKFRK